MFSNYIKEFIVEEKNKTKKKSIESNIIFKNIFAEPTDNNSFEQIIEEYIVEKAVDTYRNLKYNS